MRIYNMLLMILIQFNLPNQLVFVSISPVLLNMSRFRGAKKCCVCKSFCSKNAGDCPGCGKPCHEKCRQNFCCRPCQACWSGPKRKRSCVCGKSLRSLGVSAPEPQPITPSVAPPSNKRKKTSAAVITPDLPTLDKENIPRHAKMSSINAGPAVPAKTEMQVHPHEEDREYLLHAQVTRGDTTKWEDCRILSKFKAKTVAAKRDIEKVFCTIECRLREDLGETVPFRPQQPLT